jgi:hypothetical protein
MNYRVIDVLIGVIFLILAPFLGFVGGAVIGAIGLTAEALDQLAFHVKWWRASK